MDASPKNNEDAKSPSSASVVDDGGKNKRSVHLEWTDQIESLLSAWADTAAVYKWLHDKSHRKYKRKNKFLSIPTMILSLITGSLGIGLQGYVPAQYMSIGQGALGGMGIFIGILQGLQTQFGWAQRSEKHASSSLGWGKLHRNIQIELSVEKEFRKECDSFVKVCRMEYDRLTEQSPAIPSDVLEMFKQTFIKQQSKKDNEEELILPDVCDTIKHTKVYKNAIDNPDSLVKNVYDEDSKAKTDEIVKQALNERIKELDEKISGVNQFKLATIGNRYIPPVIHREHHSHRVHQPNHDNDTFVKPEIFRPRKLSETTINPKKILEVVRAPQLEKKAIPELSGIERPNIKNLISRFTISDNKIEIVNPLKEEKEEEEKKEDVKIDIKSEDLINTIPEEKKEELIKTPVMDVEPKLPSVNIPPLNLEQIKLEEERRQEESSKRKRKKEKITLVFSDEKDDKKDN